MKRFKGIVVLLLILASVLTPIAIMATGVLPYGADVVRTGSMFPAIPPASVVIVETDQYEVGQVTIFGVPAIAPPTASWPSMTMQR